MADIEKLMYSYPEQGEPQFSSLISTREEFWTAGQVGAASTTSVGGATTAERLYVRTFVRRFMLAFDRLFLYYSTGSGKTVISANAFEPLVREVASELVETYVAPRRTNIKKVIVIVASDTAKRDFAAKVIEISELPKFKEVAEAGRNQSIDERFSSYFTALDPYYMFYTKSSFLTAVYGSAANRQRWKIERMDASGGVDWTPEPSAISFANDAAIIIDEIHSFSREETSRGQGDEDSPKSGTDTLTEDEDTRYRQYHAILHSIKRSKLIAMSATPMKDSPNEIIKVMNLILPLERQIPAGFDVLNSEALSKAVTGYVSYYRVRTTRVLDRGVAITLDQEGRVGDASVTAREPTKNFVTIFPIKMSDLQVKAYRAATSEVDPFNRNALRVGNVVYPDGSWGSSGFDRYFRTYPGVEGKVATDELKSYLRSSKENRTRLCPKGVAFADLCDMSDGTVFGYAHNLEGGLYDIAAVLEASGYERFIPQESSMSTVSDEQSAGEGTLFRTSPDGKTRTVVIPKRKRFVLITGSTKTIRGRFETIMSLIKITENARGDYVKCILGSAAVREAFDLPYCLNVVILSPEQTETAMIQALGRVIRPGGQAELLKQRPDLPEIVNFYKFAAYIPGKTDTELIYEGKDVETYIESARKDRLIKIVERTLRDSSVDCQMLHNVNYDEDDNVVDDSPACLYGPCNYPCMTEYVPFEDRDMAAMTTIYRPDRIGSVYRFVRSSLVRRSVIAMDELNDVSGSEWISQAAIESMTFSKVLVRDMFGRLVFAYGDGSCLYVSPDPTLTRRLGDPSVGMNPISMSEYSSGSSLVTLTSLDRLAGPSALLFRETIQEILATIPNYAVTRDVGTDYDFLLRFSNFVRREIVSKASIMEHIRLRGEQRVKGIQGETVFWVNYAGLLNARGDVLVHETDEHISELIQRTPSGKPLKFTRELTSKEREVTTRKPDEDFAIWKYPSGVLARILLSRWRGYMVDMFGKMEAKYKMFGVTEPTNPNVLRIATRGKDNSKTRGRSLYSCNQADVEDLMEYLTGDRRKEEITEIGITPKLNDMLLEILDKKGMMLRL